VKLLLNDNRVDFNKAENIYGWTPFYVACYNGHIEIVKLLLNDERVDINKTSNSHRDGSKTPFHIACENGHIETVKLLLNDKRVDINKAEKDGETPLYIVCYSGSTEIVKLLLNEKRISIRKKTNKGKTVFDIAKTNNHSEIMKLIKEADTGNLAKRLRNRNETIVNKNKIEQRYSEYLETFEHFPFLYIENETINKQDFLVLNEHLKKNKNIKELRLF